VNLLKSSCYVMGDGALARICSTLDRDEECEAILFGAPYLFSFTGPVDENYPIQKQ